MRKWRWTLVVVGMFCFGSVWGQFGPAQVINDCALICDPVDAQHCDFDQDGDSDLFFSFYGLDVVWFKNDGKGNFSKQIISKDSIYGLRRIIGFDLNKDKKNDIIAIHPNGRLIWYQNIGNNKFEEKEILRLAENKLGIIEKIGLLQIADLDNDAVFDLIIYSSESAQLLWCKGIGDGKFSMPHIIAEKLKWIKSLMIEDLNRDRLMDILPAFHPQQTSQVFWFRNKGQGDFMQVTEKEIPENVYINEVRILDIDRDKDLDLCYASRNKTTYKDKLIWLENDGRGQFSQKSVLLENTLIEKFVFVDFDKDVDQDLFLKMFMGHGLFKNEKNTFSQVQKISPGGGDTDYSVLADLDNNGYTDILTGSHQDDLITLHLNDGKTIQEGKIMNKSAGTPTAILVKNIDGDNLEDLIGTTTKWSSLFWRKNDLKSFSSYQDVTYAVAGPLALAVADLDGDGFNDVVSGTRGQKKIAWHKNNGQGQFKDMSILSTNIYEVSQIMAVDIDADQDFDVVVVSPWDRKISWFENDGHGNFCPELILADSREFLKLDIADLDGDGDLDVLTLLKDAPKMLWFKNDGLKHFQEQQFASISNSPQYWMPFKIIDFDNDGDRDVLGGIDHYGHEPRIVVFENLGSGEFVPEKILLKLDKAISFLAFEDIDLDGDKDFVCGFDRTSIVRWYENNGQGQFITWRTITYQIPEPTMLVLADLDKDGDLDLLAGSAISKKIVWHENLTITSKK